jgi:hypothetical protein
MNLFHIHLIKFLLYVILSYINLFISFLGGLGHGKKYKTFFTSKEDFFGIFFLPPTLGK